MREQLTALATLNEIDTSTSTLDGELKEVPARVNQLGEHIQRLEALLEKERERLQEATALKVQHDEEIKRLSTVLAQAKSKTAKASNTREANAVEREIDHARRAIKDREQERENLQQAVDQVQSSLTQHDTEIAELRKHYTEEKTQAQARVAELEQERTTILGGREELLAKLDNVIVRRYEAIRNQRGTGIARVVEGSCVGCGIALAPQQYIEVQRGQSIEQCQSCRRILVFSPEDA